MMQYLIESDGIEKLNLSNRSKNTLYRAGIHDIGSFIRVDIQSMKNIKNLGVKSIEEIFVVIDKIKSNTEYQLVSDQDMETLPAQAMPPQKLFINHDGVTCEDIPIDKLGLSVRAHNCLRRKGIQYTSELLDATIESLSAIKNMGQKSALEILAAVKWQTFEIKESADTTNYSPVEAFLNDIISDIKIKLNIHAGLLYQALKPIIENYTESLKHDLTINNTKLMHLLYGDDFLRNEIKKHIMNLLQQFTYGMPISTLFAQLPSYLEGTNIADEILLELLEDHSIQFMPNGNIDKNYPTIEDFANSLPTEKDRDIFLGRLRGLTLEELGQSFDITRERIRQIINKYLRRRTRLQEDRYAKVFKKYSFSKSDFKLVFEEPDETYIYLSIKYDSEKAPLEGLLEDESFPIEIRRAAEKAIYRNYVTVGSERIKCSRNELAEYVLRTFFKNEATFDEFCEFYSMFLEEQGLSQDEKLMISTRGYENRLADSNYVLWKYGKRLRYYNMNEFDFGELLHTLDFSGYHDVEYSTLKFFRDYRELMQNYDIRDEYELHNLLKKLCNKSDLSGITIKRMPNIEIGMSNRDQQVLNVLLRCAPISINDLADAYEAEYGVRAETVMANYLKSFDGYFYNGMYVINTPPLPPYQAQLMDDILSEEFYTIEEAKRLCTKAFPEEDPVMLNPHTLKQLGFKVFSSFAIKSRYLSAAEYFRALLLGTDTVDARSFPKELVNTISYSSELYALKARFEIIEFSPLQYVNIRRLNSAGITILQLHSYIDAVYDITDKGDFFTIQSLKKRGFTHPLYKLGFNDWFYASLLTEDKQRFSYGRFGGTKIFVKGNIDANLTAFLESIIERETSIDIYDLIELLESNFGIRIGRWKIIEIIKSSSMHYDSIMEKIYIDYDTYFEEV